MNTIRNTNYRQLGFGENGTILVRHDNQTKIPIDKSTFGGTGMTIYLDDVDYAQLDTIDIKRLENGLIANGLKKNSDFVVLPKKLRRCRDKGVRILIDYLKECKLLK